MVSNRVNASSRKPNNNFFIFYSGVTTRFLLALQYYLVGSSPPSQKDNADKSSQCRQGNECDGQEIIPPGIDGCARRKEADGASEGAEA